MITRLRWFSSVLGPASFALMANGHTDFGVAITLVGQSCFMPYAISNRSWDLVGVSSFFAATGIHSLVS